MKESGFTIIELILSILILSIAIVGIFSSFSIMDILTSDQSDKLIGTYLAQEGMEIARNIRDTNWLNMQYGPGSGYSWDDNLNCSFGCEADYTTGTGVPNEWQMAQWASRYLYVSNSDGFYGYNTGNSSKTKFKRNIIITPVTDVDGRSDHIIKVEVQVSWDQKPNILFPIRYAGNCEPSNCVTVWGTLYNWYNYNSAQ